MLNHLLFVMACTSPDLASTADTAEDTAVVGPAEDSGIVLDTGESYHGSFPEERIPAPEFAAVNRDGAARALEDLLGQPTVMWFYPAASSYG